MLRTHFTPLIPCFFVIVTLVIGCGKKAEEERGSSTNDRPMQMSELESELNQQELFCGSDRTCPSYLTKIAVVSGSKLKFCTGFLTDENVVATASSCLPERLRSRDLPCDKDVFFFFAQANEKPKRVGCKKVLEVSQIEGKEPFLWRSDIAYLQLNTNEHRRFVSYSRAGMADLDHFYTWTVDQLDSHQGIIRKSEDCQSVHNSYFNPLANNEFSPVMTMGGCDYIAGNSGAPIFDYRGKVRGVVSSPVDPKEINEVLATHMLDKPLKKLMHVSNFACAPTIPDEEVANENECSKILDYNAYDVARHEMINESNLFKTSIQKIELAANEKNRYLKFSVKLVLSDETYQAFVFPKCFKNVSKWINSLSNSRPYTFTMDLPDVTLKKYMNEFGRIIPQEIYKESISTNFQFKPSLLRSNRQANVYMWAQGPTTTFQNLQENCGSLL
jgi:hypothetical protein